MKPLNVPMEEMTMRDHFAALVLQGLTQWGGLWSKEQLPMLAAYAYDQADAMLAKREKDTLI